MGRDKDHPDDELVPPSTWCLLGGTGKPPTWAQLERGAVARRKERSALQEKGKERKKKKRKEKRREKKKKRKGEGETGGGKGEKTGESKSKGVKGRETQPGEKEGKEANRAEDAAGGGEADKTAIPELEPEPEDTAGTRPRARRGGAHRQLMHRLCLCLCLRLRPGKRPAKGPLSDVNKPDNRST